MHSTRVAVTFDSCNEVGIVSRTYGQLLSLANELTSLLEKHGLQNQNIFGLYCHPGVNLPNWILGILQLPAAYAPLDPDSPPLLSVTVMDQCGLTYALVQSNILQRFQSTFFPHLCVEVCGLWHNQGLTLVKIQRKGLVPWSLDQGMQEQCGDGQVEEQQQQLAVMAERDAGPQGALAYILHTSGTTGSPKTVRVPHQCIMPNIQHLRDLFQVTPDDVVFMASPLTFDPSVVEMFLSLSSGACLLIVPSVIKKVSSRLARVLFQKHRTTVIQATPTLLGRFGGRVLRGLVLSGSSTLRVLALGGEPCPPLSVLRSWRAEGNSTRIFNLYGITEVSCWATCYELHLENMNLDSVPLGSALRDTVVEVRGEDGAVVTQGDGQIFIGGQRVCFLGTEMTVAKGTMRGTGDWVQVRDSHLYYLGRRDRLVKRHGQKLHLDALHQVLESLPQVEMCAVTLWEGKRVVAFVVPTSSSEDPVPSSGALKREILAGLSGLLPSHCVPDSILLLPELPLTSHGKVNMRKLLQVYERQRAPLISQDALGKRDTLRKHLQILWREALSFCDDVLVSEDSRFLLSGGDSIRSLRLCDDITAAVGVSMPGLLEVILNGSFSDLLCHVAMATFEMAPRALPPDHSSPPPAKKKLQDSSSPVTAKKKLPDPFSPVCLKRRPMEFVVVRRAGEVVEMPLQAIHLQNGEMVWERVLGGRIEASAAVTCCGSLIVIGCYDGQVYFLAVDTGKTHWAFGTGDAVKCSPVVDTQTGLVLVGSHDGHMYALDPEGQRCVWSRHCGGGAIFSSPCLHPSLRQLYVATLRGQLHCLCPETGALVWTYSSTAPFFSSPCCCDTVLCIGSVDGSIYGFSHTGHMMWQFPTSGPVFSSPCSLPASLANQTVFCGSHDGGVYCVRSCSGSLVWRFGAGAKVFSSPFLFEDLEWGSGGLVAVASTDGTLYILGAEDGELRASLSLPGEIFSSPVLWRRTLVVGCRNDYVYGIELTTSSQALPSQM
ncbi:hypothetical protein AGOR_G00171370 [Albula goreensis]|uniref:Carrier domain-containing protein n=1 Tax=Albula goreensis TaxID=1534307 RepID=A0A8T3CZ91_9TELE|nr:hypothetical protein AGOR_G00171370 [Albula goreensis]